MLNFRLLLQLYHKERTREKNYSRPNSVLLTNNEAPSSWRRLMFNDYSIITIIHTAMMLLDNPLHERTHNATRTPGIWSASENELSSRARAHSYPDCLPLLFQYLVANARRVPQNKLNQLPHSASIHYPMSYPVHALICHPGYSWFSVTIAILAPLIPLPEDLY